jgi:hypothetical protein
MRTPKIEVGAKYFATDIYDVSELRQIEVRVLGVSRAAADHWLCEREDGTKTHLPSQAFIRPVPKSGRRDG